ncbi:class I SAM-dependent methyltransferase [Candidatus Microgenomates bacterium]|nr:class I SAM-dependent methyltransferase [Candidatus Microgenomates bacterium]
MRDTHDIAVHLHENVPPDWYERSIKHNLLQRFWHTRRFRQVSKLIEPAEVILDIGCADGTFTKVVWEKTKAKKLIGIDVLKSSIEYAKKRFKNNNGMEFHVADAHNLPFKTGEFDAVFCLEALEHVIDPLRVLQEIHRVLKNGGYAIVLVPSENWLFHSVVWPLWQKWPGKNIWQHTHLHNFSNGFLEELVAESGFHLKVVKKFLLGMLFLVKVKKI